MHISHITTRRSLFGIIFTIFLATLLFLPFRANTRPAEALENGLARTPPMGWNSWNRFRCKVDEQLIRETADALVASGMRDAGYSYVVIDDCWQTSRMPDGTIFASSRTFPSGIPALAEYVHARGLKLGLYTDVGRYTCQGRPGSLGYEFQDATTYAAWGVDFVKLDWCFTKGLDAAAIYATWRDAIASTGRPMVLSISEWGVNAPWNWAPDTGNMWRTTDDIIDDWETMLRNLDQTAPHAWAAGPGRWNDPDMLEVGNGGMTLEEYRAHFSMWAILAAPLIAGNDLRTMPPEILEILTNREVIAVDQDPAGIQGNIVDDTGTGLQVWAKPLADGSRAVALLNRSETQADITARWEKIGLPPGDASVRDLWAHEERGVARDSYTASVPAHGVVMLKIGSTQIYTPLSSMAWSAISNGYGPAEIDRSNGENAAGDGRPLTLNGVQYSTGLGLHAPAEAVYSLQGRCGHFSAVVGIDDEAGTFGAVSFQLWADGALRYDSGPLTGDSPAQTVSVDLTGTHELRLIVTDGGDWTDLDHANWADARIVCTL